MKYQFVKKILGISLAVCTVYGSVRGAYAAVTGAYAAEAVVYPVQESTYAASDVPDTSVSADMAAASVEKEAILPEQEPEKEAEILPDPEPEEEAEILPDPEPEEEAEILPDPGPEEPEVTLEEYLSGLRCGACGRCCSLIRPHCRNGKHKAQSAEQQYYEMYSGDAY